jgi:rhodanese-related sulfurtransferase
MSDSEIDVQTLAAARAAGCRVFDVREPFEYAEERIPGSTLIPFADVPEEIEQFEGTDTVYLVCHSGARSGRAAEFLRRNGIDAVNVSGGLVAWIQAGLPTESSAE